MQQHLSSYDTVTPPPYPLSTAFLKQEGRNTTATLQYKKGGKEKILQHLSSYDTVTPPPEPPLHCLYRDGREKYNSISPVLSISPIKF
jgi:hypothetical protein